MWTTAIVFAMRLLLLVALSNISLTAWCATPPDSIANDFGADANLLRAVNQQHFDDFVAALDAGANPNRIFGPHYDEWAMCRATDEGREEFLAELLTRGGDPNLENVDAGTLSRRPIACTMGFGNLQAFEMLLAAGADPNAQLCDDCAGGHGWSVFESSLSSGNSAMAVRLTEVADLTDRDHETLVQKLERSFIPRTPVTEKTIPALVRYLATKGIIVEEPTLIE